MNAVMTKGGEVKSVGLSDIERNTEMVQQEKRYYDRDLPG